MRHRAIGTITRESVAAAYLGWIHDAAFDPFIPILWDCRNQSLQVTTRELINLPRWTNQTTDRRRPGLRTAVLVSNHVAEYAAGTVADNPAWVSEIRVFREEPAALAWLSNDRYTPCERS